MKVVEGVLFFDFMGKIYYCGFFIFEIGVVYYDVVVLNLCVLIMFFVLMGDFIGGVNYVGFLNLYRW